MTPPTPKRPTFACRCAGAAQAYYGLAVARQAVEITRQAHENAEAHYALAKRQVAAGAAPPLAELPGRAPP
ncbi:MAG: TolC family protein [Deltaproteobacteria bacterium]|nr:TolC family protein [Deltaproteobacteria bacterium]